MIIRGGGGGGWGGLLTSLTSTSFTLRKMQTLYMLSVVSKINPTKGSSWPKSTTNKISLLRLRLIIFEVVCGINPIEPLLLVLNKWMEHGNTWKNGDLRRCSTKKNPKRVQKKVHLGLQLDMASQRCLVADCGFCFATSALAPLASRRGRNWKSECRPDMIRMIENHRFLMFLTLEEQNRVTAQAKRRFSLLSHTPANRHECPCCKPFLDDSCKYQHFVSYPQKSEFQIRHPYKGAESTGCLVFTAQRSHLGGQDCNLVILYSRPSEIIWVAHMNLIV